MALKFIVGLISGAATALVIGYCDYFIRSRRSAPDNNKKVHERREQNAEKKLVMTPSLTTGVATIANTNMEPAEVQQQQLQQQQQNQVKEENKQEEAGSNQEGNENVSERQMTMEEAKTYFKNCLREGQALCRDGQIDAGTELVFTAVRMCDQPKFLVNILRSVLPPEAFFKVSCMTEEFLLQQAPSE